MKPFTFTKPKDKEHSLCPRCKALDTATAETYYQESPDGRSFASGTVIKCSECGAEMNEFDSVSEDTLRDQELLEALKKLQSGKIPKPFAGICYNVGAITHWKPYDISNIMYAIFDDLYKGERDPSFPVRENYFSSRANKWDKRTKAGKDRWLVLSEVINYLEERILS